MTDKQIIIDGVDVSGCVNHTDELKDCSCRLTYATFHYRFCEQNPNCYYKQLKRKEQECERLMSTLTEIKEIAKHDVYITRADLRFKLDLIKNKISECEAENG